MNITKITIGRLYNLGSYEHVRYELSCDVADGESASTALVGIERLLKALNPKRPVGVPEKAETEREIRNLTEMREMDEEKFESYHRGYVGTREEYLGRIQESITKGVANRAIWEAQQRQARALLDDLGGAAAWKDAKLEWEDWD